MRSAKIINLTYFPPSVFGYNNLNKSPLYKSVREVGLFPEFLQIIGPKNPLKHPYKNHNCWLMLKRMRGMLCPGTVKIYTSQMTKIYPFLTVFGLLLGLTASAQFTKYSNEFLNIGAGARGMAMAGAQSASV